MVSAGCERGQASDLCGTFDAEEAQGFHLLLGSLRILNMSISKTIVGTLEVPEEQVVLILSKHWLVIINTGCEIGMMLGIFRVFGRAEKVFNILIKAAFTLARLGRIY
eukprot:112746-Pelagomonas_calceolata.AAC.1